MPRNKYLLVHMILQFLSVAASNSFYGLLKSRQNVNTRWEFKVMKLQIGKKIKHTATWARSCGMQNHYVGDSHSSSSQLSQQAHASWVSFSTCLTDETDVQ